MSDPLQGWLDIRPALKDNSFGSNDKWNKVSKARRITKLNSFIHVPAFSLEFVNIYGISLIVAQYNFATNQPFTLLDYPFLDISTESPENLCFVAIRYRIGTESFRRILYNKDGFVNFDCPFYKGEIIKNNFVIEFWTKGFQSPGEETIALNRDLYLKTSILNVPNSAYDSISLIEPSGNLFTNLFITLPQAMPMPDVNPLGPWLTN